MSSKDSEGDTNWYDVLELPISSTTEEIEKAVRRQSKIYHPDRNKHPDAPKKFLYIQKAKDVLLDEEKRKVLDARLSATLKRKAYESERVQTMDASRKRMRAEFESKLAAASAGVPAQGQRGVADVRSHDYRSATSSRPETMSSKLNKLRQDGRERAEALRQEAAQSWAPARREEGPTSEQDGEVKVKWRRNPGVISESDESLRVLFKPFGDVTRVSMHKDKGNQASVAFASLESAQAAVDHFASSSEYRVSLAESRRARMFTFNYRGGASAGGSSASLADLDRKLPSDAGEAERSSYDAELEDHDVQIFVASSVAELKSKEAVLMARLSV
jgi:curved DNA-binding protein CbpA